MFWDFGIIHRGANLQLLHRRIYCSGTLLLGNVGKVWMSIVAILAVISTVNSNIAGLSHIAAGMAKIGLLPEFL